MTKIKTRKLYEVRWTPRMLASRPVGYKGRLLPLRAATRIAKRLRRAGVDVYLATLQVNVTPEQIAYLARRYG